MPVAKQVQQVRGWVGWIGTIGRCAQYYWEVTMSRATCANGTTLRQPSQDGSCHTQSVWAARLLRKTCAQFSQTGPDADLT